MFVNHCHLLPPGLFAADDPLRGTPGGLLAAMDNLGIDRAVVFAPLPGFIPDAREANQWLWEQVRDNERFTGFMTLNPVDSRSLPLMQEFAAKGLCGLKIHPPAFRARLDDEAAYPFYELAATLSLPILFHTGVHGWLLENYMPILLDRVAHQFPDLKIIVEHMGGWEFFDQALAVVRNNRNCYAGITSTLAAQWAWYLTPDRLRYMALMVGVERVIFGTDYPFRTSEDIGQDIQVVREVFGNPETVDRILGANLAALLGCE